MKEKSERIKERIKLNIKFL